MKFCLLQRSLLPKKWFYLTLMFLCSTVITFAQLEVQVNVLAGVATTACTAGGDTPNPQWAVNIENEGWTVYPEAGFCFTDVPNVQFSESYTCFATTPDSIEVCFSAFDDDGFFCFVNPSCAESICQNFVIPAPGTTNNHSLVLPGGGGSTGSVDFELSSTGVVFGANDLICDAVELGQLEFGTSLGDPTLSNYNNYCATNLNEPNPNMEGFWGNNLGVWFHFTTGTDIGTVNYLNAVSDPEGLGDGIDLQLALYKATGVDCTGGLDLEIATYTGPTQDEAFYAYCLEENTSYYILVDGANAGPGLIDGYFGLEVINAPAVASGDLICEAEDFGMVPAGGVVGSPELQSNVCALAISDPNPSSFISQYSVWFSFLAPDSKHVVIEATTDQMSTDPVDIQLALYETNNNLCTGFKQEVASINTPVAYDETLTVECLVPGQRYWILMDGAGTVDSRGTFMISVADGGPLVPQSTTMIDETLCFGESLTVGGFVYQSSSAIDVTLTASNGCDSLVTGTLVVLDELTASTNQSIFATGVGAPDGEATVAAMGGDGNYTYEWSNTQNTTTATNLVGGETYCVTVTDGNACSAVSCLEILYPNNIISLINNDTLDCFGDTNGTISFDANNGLAPYNFTWNGVGTSLTGNGTIATEGGTATLTDLPAGVYEILLSDAFVDTLLYAEVVAATPLQISLDNQVNASCFGDCDGSISLAVNGGTSPYNYNWQGTTANTPNPTNLCAGVYALTLTDAKNCEAFFSVEITEPPAIVVSVLQTQAVSCFGGNDGQASVTTAMTNLSYQWSNGQTTAQATELEGGIYGITITDIAGCSLSENVVIDAPNQALSSAINIIEEISCFDSEDGIVQVIPTNTGTHTYQWTNGATTDFVENLAAGTYTVTLTNDLACTSTNEISLSAPTAIEASFTTQDITCFAGTESGAIEIVSVSGGVGPYDFSLNDNAIFQTDSLFAGLAAGGQAVWIRDAEACVKRFPLTLGAPDPVIVTTIEDTEIKLGESILLNSNTNTLNGLYTWNITEELACNDCLSPTVSPTERTLYQLSVLDTLTGCTGTAEVKIEVSTQKNVFIPNAFSPNFDGANDFFTVYSDVGVAQVNYLRVFDRWGALVYEVTDFNANDEQRGWDGTYRGKQMNTGVYLYVAEVLFLDGTTLRYGGDVSLLD